MRLVLAMLFLCFVVTLPAQAQTPVNQTDKASEVASPAEKAQRNERAQIVKLWNAHLTRSPDINFVLQKLIVNDPDKVNAYLESQIERAMSPQRMNPDVMMIADPSMGDTSYPKLKSIVHDHTYAPLSEKTPRVGAWSSHAASKSLTKTEQIQLQNMVRNTADKLVEAYRTYVGLSSPSEKKNQVDGRRAKARQDLIDMCGVDAVQELDAEQDAEKISKEYIQIEKLLESCTSHSSDLVQLKQRFEIPPEVFGKLFARLTLQSVGGSTGGYTISTCGHSVFETMKTIPHFSDEKKSVRVSQTEQIQLYNTMRRTGDMLLDHYRSYVDAVRESKDSISISSNRISLETSRKNLEEMVGEAAVKDLDTELY